MRVFLRMIYFKKYHFPTIHCKQHKIHSEMLAQKMTVDVFYPQIRRRLHNPPIILVNDGQDLHQLGIKTILRKLLHQGKIPPCIIVGIRSTNRMHDLGTTHHLEASGWGQSAQVYQSFLVKELIPSLQDHFGKKSPFYIAGFSLGGLSALDTALNHHDVFKGVGIFSGALWWRSKKLDIKQPDAHLIIPEKINNLNYLPRLFYWFQAGTLEETNDRNKNGVIDVIDDTLHTIKALEHIGTLPKNIYFTKVKGGKHRYETWKQVFPKFLVWSLQKDVGSPCGKKRE